jgi:hypothetical protein
MTSTIKVNNIQNQCGANIINENSNTITLGASGDTVTLASGASQSGFGRTGTVDWQTGSIKTATFTATSGEGYFCNTTSGSFTVNLPAGSAGAIVSIQDYNNTFDSNALTITPNGSEKINGGAGSIGLSTEGEGITLVYIDGTVGWRSIQDNDFASPGSNFITATGGTISTCGDFKIHTFTGPGTFAVTGLSTTTPADNTADYLVVAGGGGGGVADIGGGGGAGGFRVSNDLCMPAPTTSPLANPTGLTMTVTSFPITVGAGGAAITGTPPSRPASNPGSNSIFSTITSAGGGGGGSGPSPCGPTVGQPGGSGGGAGYSGGIGNGNTPPVSPPQGSNGGAGAAGPPAWGQGGGGGAGAVGGTGTTTAGGVGGAGSFVSPTMAGCNGTTGPVGSTRYFAGGGGGAVDDGTPGRAGAVGGSGGGGRGYATDPNNNAVDGTTNTGGGGGGASVGTVPTNTTGAGGSGIVIIRYKFQ